MDIWYILFVVLLFWMSNCVGDCVNDCVESSMVINGIVAHLILFVIASSLVVQVDGGKWENF
ncbi:putative membrane protein [Photobacterium leiognathi lrivu.4.1]|uniref:Putative membrane protein n=1 Tax=Photobacterium leiognathi lrivu.4.1 TaxID=1248232 RepID=A0A0U1P5F6_PHOLE|nr:putative membrane protein [Photobacterium leiognathi lrivu.4.1]